MSALALAAALLATQAVQGEPAAQVVRHALAAVEGDSVARVEATWRRRLSGADVRPSLLGLAALAQYTYRDTQAVELLHRLATSTPDAYAGWAGLLQSRQYAVQGVWPLADSTAERAVATARTLGDSVLLGEGLLALATARRRTQGGTEPAAFIAEAARVLPDSAYAARARVACSGSVLAPGIDANAMLASLREGVDLATRAGDERTRAGCYHAAAGVYARLGPAESTFAMYRRAEEIFRATHDRAGLAVVLQWRSYYWFLIGSFGHAQRDGEESIREAEAARAWLVVPWARSSLARVALGLGDYAAAAKHAAEATRLFANQGDRYAEASSHSLESSLAFALGDTATARVMIEANLRRTSDLGWLEAQAAGWEGFLQLALMRDDFAAARRGIDSLRAVAQRGQMTGRLGALTFWEGNLALREGRLAAAERLFRGRSDRVSRQGNWDYAGGARLAEILVRLGRLDEAESEIRAASARLDSWRNALGDSELRQLAFQMALYGPDPDLGIATVIAGLARAGRIPTAFEVAERGRARELADRLNRASALDPTPATAARGGQSITLGHLLLEIPDSATALLEYVTGLGDPTTVFVVTSRGARAYVLTSQDSLREPIARLSALLEEGEDARALGREVGRAVLDPVLADLEPSITRLVIVPDGPLHRVPFDVLGLPDGRLVVEQFAVASVPSASVAVRLWRRRSAAPPGGLLALADPRFAGETSAGTAGADVFRSAVNGEAGLPRLRGSGREGRVVARYVDQPTVRRRRDASEQWLKQNTLTSYGVIHFATHALVDEGSITNTALALAPEGSDDGFVRPAELAALGLQAELVVLSACRTAGGVIVRGEGIQGLAAPLLAAGARAVAATWWPIGDQATVRLVEDFYAAMARGLPAGDALREAKLAAMSRGAPAREWASFTIVGDPLAHPALRAPRPRSPLLPVALVVVLAALAAYGVAMWKRRNSDRASVPSESNARTQ